MKIRQALPSDIDALLKIDSDLFSDPFPKFVMRQLLDLAGPLAAVAEEQEILGYVLGARDFTNTKAWALSAAVLRTHQHRGIARKLIEHLFTQMRTIGISEAFLTVRPENLPILKIAEHLGAVTVADDPEYFGAGQRRLVLKLDLSV